MQVHVVRDPREGAYLVWAWERRNGETCLYEVRPTPGGTVEMCLPEDGWRTSGTLEEQPPTYRIPYEIFDALLQADSPELVPGNALVDALKDARTVRDRLLTIIEARENRRGDFS